MTKDETGKILLAVAGIFPNFKPNAMTAPMWTRLLADMPYSAVISALESYIASGKEFAPTPGQLLEILRVRALSAEDLVTPDEAWTMAVSAACVGHLRGLNHAKTLAAIAQIGFDRIRLADLETEIHFARRDFIAAYERSAKRDDLQRSAISAPEKVKALVAGLVERKLIQ